MKEITETDSESYTALEMPLGGENIRMPIEELRRLCREYKLPLFKLKVELEVYNGMAHPVPSPYTKYFAVKWGWCFIATEKNEETAPEGLDVEKVQQQLQDGEFEQLPADEEGQIGFRRKDGEVVIV